MPSDNIFSGLKVVDFASFVAAPGAAVILSDFGADVIKVEPPSGDPWRHAHKIPPQPASDDPYQWHLANRNKRSITLDLKDPSAVAWLKDYLAEADVLLHNLRPGAMAELGLDAESLCARYPRLVYGALSAFGHKGPRRLQLGYEPLVQAFAGIFSVNGAEDGEPARVGVPILDMGTGMWLALGCIAALLRRTQTGRGGTVDASLFETALTWLTVAFSNFQVSGQVPVRHRTGSRRLIVFEAFAATDGEIIIAAANDRLFRKLAIALGRPEWAEDERFTTNAQRLAHKDVLLPEIRAIIARQPSEHWVDLLEAAGVPCAPVQDVKHAVAEPQAAALGMIADVPESGLSLIGLPLSFDGERPPMRRRAPELGEHNGELRRAKGKAAE